MFDEMQASIATLAEESPVPAARPDPEATDRPPHPSASPLCGTIARCVTAALIGAIFGAAALSSAIKVGNAIDVLSVTPLVMALVTLVGGWVGAMFCLDTEMGEQA